jgi:hypothetical protein
MGRIFKDHQVRVGDRTVVREVPNVGVDTELTVTLHHAILSRRTAANWTLASS